jgi:hypothetical protein
VTEKPRRCVLRKQGTDHSRKRQESWKVADYKAPCIWKCQKDDDGVTGMNLEQLKEEMEASQEASS